LIIFYFIIGSTKAMPRLQSKDKYVLHDSSLELYLTKLLQNLMTVSPQHVTTDQQPLTKTRLMITVQQYTRHVTMFILGSDLQDFDGSGHDTSPLGGEGQRSSTAA